MGALAMHIHWAVEDCPDASDLHQYFYFDATENGFETYKSVWNNDQNDIQVIEQTLVGCLGGKQIEISEKEARDLFTVYTALNKKNEQPLPEGEPEYRDLLGAPEPDAERKLILLEKCCTKIESEYQLIHYFLMRSFEKDLPAAEFLAEDGVCTEPYKELGQSSMCRNVIDRKDSSYLCRSLVEENGQYRLLVTRLQTNGDLISLCERQSGFRVSSSEAAMMLSRSEFITVYEMIADPEDISDEILEFNFNTMITPHENGRLFMTFNSNNDHVKKRIFRLSEDVMGLYYLTDYGQFLAASYDEEHIRILERSLISSTMGTYLIPTAKYEFKEPVLYEFINSDFTDFEEFLDIIRDDDE